MERSSDTTLTHNMAFLGILMHVFLKVYIYINIYIYIGHA